VAYEGFEIYFHIFIILALEGGGISVRPERLTCGETTVVPVEGGRLGAWVGSTAFRGHESLNKNTVVVDYLIFEFFFI
jgi:hypothetical protein